jgi:hypothetical protein
MTNARKDLEAACSAIEPAYWLSGTLPERIKHLLEERELAIEGKHPIQLERAKTRIPFEDGVTILTTHADSGDAKLFQTMFDSQMIRNTIVVDVPRAMRTAHGKLNPAGGALVLTPDGQLLRTMFDICEWIQHHGLCLL